MCVCLSLSLFWRRLLHISRAGRLRAWDFPTPHSKPLILCFGGNIKQRHRKAATTVKFNVQLDGLAEGFPPPLSLPPSLPPSLFPFLARSLRCVPQLTKTHSFRQGLSFFVCVSNPRHRRAQLASNGTSAHPKTLRRWTERCVDGRQRVLQQLASMQRWSGVKRAS